ncbi:MAG: hypothetical protein Q7R58_02020 [bacterium]|nr:hypothetical protein [bacterium]
MDPDRRKKIITISVLVAVVLGVAFGYYYFKNKTSSATDVQSAADVVAQGVLPSIGEAANPLSNKPDINPTSKTNPFDSVKTNPFD